MTKVMIPAPNAAAQARPTADAVTCPSVHGNQLMNLVVHAEIGVFQKSKTPLISAVTA